ncbi:MAG: TRAP transporter permease [Proteobacteria bacterium]|nr:TRAP transporter permease [Pseudomonadota bacterium]
MTEPAESRALTAVRMIVAVVAIAMSVYHVIVAGMVTPPFYVHYPLHIFFALSVLFTNDWIAHWQHTTGGRRFLLLGWDAVLIAVTGAATAYLFTNNDYVMNRFTWFEELTPLEIALASGLVLALLEAARRTVGWVLVAVVGVFIVYGLVGALLPEPFWHRGQPVGRLLELFYFTPDGIFNVPVKATADYIFLFVLLGAFLIASGAGKFFTDLAEALTGRSVGGPAKTAVVSSALMGMLQGSSAGNVVTTGPFTIPAMRKMGYPAPYAAGVEATASTGGQLTPPIMGAAAFLMSEFTAIPYAHIMRMAVIPAFLYFFAVFAMVDLEARRLNLRPDRNAALPRIGPILRERGYLVLPLVVMVWFLIEGYTPTKAGFWALVSLFGLVVALDGANRRRIFHVLYEAATEGPRMIAPVTVACAVGGMIAGIIVLTGLGLRLSSIILAFSGGYVLAALILTMIACLILGMGMPTSAAYIILAALLAPGLESMGVPKAAAHLFIIYAAAKSAITPPVAVASYAAAAVAGTDPWETSTIAFRLGLSVFIIPYMFVFGPELLSLGDPFGVAWSFLTACFGIFALSVASAGWLQTDLKAHERLIALLAAVSMIYPEWRSDLLGLVVFAALVVVIRMRLRRAAGGRSMGAAPAADADER